MCLNDESGNMLLNLAYIFGSVAAGVGTAATARMQSRVLPSIFLQYELTPVPARNVLPPGATLNIVYAAEAKRATSLVPVFYLVDTTSRTPSEEALPRPAAALAFVACLILRDSLFAGAASQDPTSIARAAREARRGKGGVRCGEVEGEWNDGAPGRNDCGGGGGCASVRGRAHANTHAHATANG